MRRIPQEMLLRMAACLRPEDRDEMAIPSYVHRQPIMRWMAWRRVEVMARHLRRACADAPQPVIMDFGCGTGILFDEASRCARRVYGVDPVLDPARLLVEEWGLDKVELLTPERAAVEVPEGGVDIILAAEVLEHLDPLEDTLAFFRRCLRPGGKLLVSLPSEGMLYRIGRRLAGFHGHYHHSNASMIHPGIIAAGFLPLRLKKIPAGGPLAIYWVIDYQEPDPGG